MSDHDVVVIGAGAAGMMCAAQAGQRGRSVLLIEHYHLLGEKIRISGGGRCNFTNSGATAANFLSQNPDFCRSALARYTPRHFIALVEKYGIAYHEKKLGQLFCDDTAQDIIRMLKARMRPRQRAMADALSPSTASSAARTDSKSSRRRGARAARRSSSPPAGCRCRRSARRRLVIVSPSNSVCPSCRRAPALVPLAFAPEALARYGDLSGVSVDAEVACNGGRFRENLLFTHRGLSGPAILQISSYWDGRAPLSIDLLPGEDAVQWLCAHVNSQALLPTLLAATAAQALRAAMVRGARRGDADEATGRSEAARGRGAAARLARAAFRHPRIPEGGSDLRRRGDTADLSSKTMGATDVPGLYFIGEVVDVTGWLGGYNFQWAWASGHAAGQFA